MSFTIVSSMLTGNPDASGWAQVQEFLPEGGQKVNKGRFFAVVAKSGQNLSKEDTLLGHQLGVYLSKEYFTQEGKPFQVLTALLTRAINEFAENIQNLTILAASLVDNVLSGAAVGNGSAILFRDKVFTSLLRANSEKVTSVSGILQEGDVLILGTNVFFETFSQGILQAAFDKGSLEDAAENLAPAAHFYPDKGALGAIFIKFGKPEVLSETAPAFGKVRKETGDFLSKKPAVLVKIADALEEKLGQINRVFAKKTYVTRNLYNEVSQRKKTAVSIGAILFLLLLISVGFGFIQKRKNEVNARRSASLSRIRHDYEESLALVNIDPDRSRELFTQSERKIREIVDGGAKDAELVELKRRLDEDRGKVLGVNTVAAQAFYDLTLLADDFSGGKLFLYEDRIFVLDPNGKKIAEVGIVSKNAKIAFGPSVVDSSALTVYNESVYLTDPAGIFDAGERKIVVEKKWQGDVLLYAYAGNLYALEKGSSSILRFVAVDAGFSSGKNWLTEAVKPDFGNIVSWAIDGSVWLLSKTGSVFKYSLGNELNFEVKGVLPEISSPKSIFTSQQVEGVYILEPEKSRVVVISKEGEYQAQYFSEALKGAVDLVVSEKEKKIILLTGGKLLSIEIKH